jgi:hypothetical protein
MLMPSTCRSLMRHLMAQQLQRCEHSLARLATWLPSCTCDPEMPQACGCETPRPARLPCNFQLAYQIKLFSNACQSATIVGDVHACVSGLPRSDGVCVHGLVVLWRLVSQSDPCVEPALLCNKPSSLCSFNARLLSQSQERASHTCAMTCVS